MTIMRRITNLSKLNQNWQDVKISRGNFKALMMALLLMSKELSENVEHMQVAPSILRDGN